MNENVSGAIKRAPRSKKRQAILSKAIKTSVQCANKAKVAKDADPIVVALGERVKKYRTKAARSLAELAAQSNVSRAMLSKVERGEKSPTLSIIARIALGLNISLSELMGAEPETADVSLIRSGDRVSFTDPQTGFQRQVLSPAHLNDGLEFLLHKIPPGQSSGILSAYKVPTEKYLVVHEGCLTVIIGESRHVLNTGDSFYFEVKSPYRFVNEGSSVCSYYLVIVRKP